MNVLIAPLPFKNSLTASEAANAIYKGISLYNSHFNIELSPIASNEKSMVNWSEIEEKVKKADCIITGEGQIDDISSEEKAMEVFDKIEEGTRGSKLYRSLGQSEFEVVPERDMFAYVGWAYGPTFGDFDNDGWLDIYATAGFKSEERGKPDG